MDAENLDAVGDDEEVAPGDDGSDTENTEAEQDAKEEPAKPAEEADKGEEEETPPPPPDKTLADFSVDDLLGDERLKTTIEKMVQSAKDKELAREKRRNAEESARRAQADRDRIRNEERQRFVEEQDYEGLYQYDAQQKAGSELQVEHARQFTDALVRQARDKYDPILGEDEVERLLQETRSQNGTPMDFADRLAESQRRMDVANAVSESRKGLPDLVAQEVQAKLAELGLAERAEKVAKGQVPSKDVTAGKAKVSKEDMTYEKASELFGLGELSWPDFKPFKDEHDRSRRK